jgi:hypothetical protein
MTSLKYATCLTQGGGQFFFRALVQIEDNSVWYARNLLLMPDPIIWKYVYFVMSKQKDKSLFSGLINEFFFL